MTLPADLASLEALLPQDRVGSVLSVQPMARGPSGAGVYAVKTTEGDFVLKIHAEALYAGRGSKQLRVMLRAAERGIAPPVVHVDEGARAFVARAVAGVPIPAVRDPAERGRALGSLVEQLKALHGLDPDGVVERDALGFARTQYATQRARPGFPAWAQELGPILDAVETTLARDPRRAVSHNDANPGNVLWDGTRAWLVDWEVAGLAHPLYDLAVVAMFLRLDDDVARRLLAQHEGVPVDDHARAAFAALRRLAALLCGLTFAGFVPDLALLPPSAPTLGEFYADLGAGRLRLNEPGGAGAFALALLREGIGVASS